MPLSPLGNPRVLLITIGMALNFYGCSRDPVITHAAVIRSEPAPTRHVRATGTVQASHVFMVQVPQISGQGGRMTLTRLVPNGVRVKQGDTLAEFDRTKQLDDARDAQAKFDDLSHQVEQKQAEFRSNAEKRRSDLQKAEADLAKAKLQLRRGSLLSDIDRLKNEAKAEDAQAHVESLIRSSHFHDLAEAAAIRVLELQRDRQKVGLERALINAERLVVRSPLAGMVALENVWRNGSMGHAQEGDQLFTGQSLTRIFDPEQMVVETMVSEPGGGLRFGSADQDVFGAISPRAERSSPAAGPFGGRDDRGPATVTKLWRIGAVSALVVLLAAGAWQMRRLQAATRLPVAPARKGDFLVI